MKRHGNASGRLSSVRYLLKRSTELASPATRSRTEPLAEWAARLRLDGRPFSFEGHEYLRAIYDDTSPHVVLSKATQIGGSTWALLRSFHSCLKGLDVGYYFPTKTHVLDFSRARVGPLLEENPALARLVQETDTVGLKRIGEGYLYLRGMASPVELISIPLDLLILDELDETSPEAKARARERLSHSDYKRIIELSNPSLPGYGIDEVYQQSDQRHWTLKCPGCGAWTALEREFPITLGQDVRIILPRPDGTFYRACPKCSSELDLATGEWVADFPDRPIHGYRISQLFSSKVDPAEILREYQTTRFPDRFYNLKIGIPWADTQRRLDEMSVLSLCTDRLMAEQADETGCYSMGVDTGGQIHVVILREDDDTDQQHLVHLAVCQTYEQLDELIERFRIDRCVIDALPEQHATREFAVRHRNVVFMCFFNESQRGAAAWSHDTLTVQVNRTEALDASRAAIRQKRVTLPRRLPIVDLFARHMASDAKKLDENEETGEKRYRYIKTAGENHFSLAFTYAWMGSQDNTGPRGWLKWLHREAVKARARAEGDWGPDLCWPGSGLRRYPR